MFLIGLGALGAFLLLSMFIALMFRRVVATNEVHIVQSSKSTTSYGKDSSNGNTYYEWPSWLPIIGLSKVVLPTSVFNLELKSYEAYDSGRLPFVVDIMAFFRISESNLAASRVSSFEELHEQLIAVVQGAARTILASNNIEEIMQGRSKFGEQFTVEVKDQLAQWGVETVKNIELMDIRDSGKSEVIHNIMNKKKSQIEMESRQEVAKNMRLAEISEVEARREVDLQKQVALQAVGLRTVETQKAVEITKQEAHQAIKEQERLTKEKEMSVLKVSSVRAAEIEKDVEIVKAEQQKQTSLIAAEATKQTSVIKAEGQKQTEMVIAEGKLQATLNESKGIEAKGTAEAEAEKAKQLAPVQAQITLAKEIGENESYQKYLLTLEQIKASQAVGVAQAEALSNADVKVITNSEKPGQGLTDVMDLFSSKGGVQVGAMLEGLSNTTAGKALVDKVTNGTAKKGLLNGAAKQ